MALLLAPLPQVRFDISNRTQEKETTVIFGGDMMFDRYIRQVIDIVGGDYVFSCIDRFLLEADMVVANLEGPITNNPSVSIYSDYGGEGNYTFTFPPETAPLLLRHNIGIVNIGNNHITNFGLKGIQSTKEFLKEANVKHFGGEGGESNVLKTEIEGIPIAFVSYNEFGGDSDTLIYQSISRAKKEGYIVVVYTHWGGRVCSPTR